MIRVLLVWLLLAAPAYAQTAQQEISRFVGFYGDELTRTGFRPDQSSTRETRINFLQATVKRFCSPLLSMKRADPGRPISDEVVVFLTIGPDYRTFADFLISGGGPNWHLSDHLEGKLPIAQPLVNPLTLGQLPEASFAPTVPGCKPPGQPEPTPIPPPTPVQPYPDENAWWGGYYEPEVAKLYFEAGLPFPDNSAAFRWFTRVAYDIRDGMTREAAAAKHLASLRAALGLPPRP